MIALARGVALLTWLVILGSGCASGRVRGGQGTEMGQAEAYEPQTKVDPPQGNVDRTSGPLTPVDTYPVLEVDLERRSPPPPPPLEPEPEPKPQPESGRSPD